MVPKRALYMTMGVLLWRGWHTPHLTSAVEVLVVPLAVVRLLPPIPLVPRAVRPRVVARLEPLLVRVRARARARVIGLG